VATIKIDEKTKIVLVSVNYDRVNEYLKKLGLSVEGEPYTRLVRLFEAMQLAPAVKLGNCNTCRGKSHIDLDCCPFCGDGEFDNSATDARTGTPEAAVLEELKVKIAASALVNPKTGQPIVKVEPGQGIRGRKKQKEQLAIPGTSAVATTEDEKPQATIATVQALDASITSIKTHLNNAGASVYEAAVVLLDVFDRKLWMQRRNENGAPTYATFTAWVDAETTISPQYAYQLMDLPKYFTREQVQTIGATKLMLTLRIEESEKKRLLETGRLDKMSVREVKIAVTQAPATTPRDLGRSTNAVGGKAQLPGGKKDKSKPGASAKPIKPIKPTKPNEPVNRSVMMLNRAPSITPEIVQLVTVSLPEKYEFQLLTRATYEGKPPVRAKSFADDPYVEMISANGKQIRIVFHIGQDGHLNGTMIVSDASAAASVNYDDEDEDDEDDDEE